MPKLIKNSAYFIQNRVCLGTCYSHCWFDTRRRLYPEELKLLKKVFHTGLMGFDSHQDALIFSPSLIHGLTKYQKRYLFKRYGLTHYHFSCRQVKEVLESNLDKGEIELYRLAFSNLGIDFANLRKVFSLMKEWDIFNHLRYITE